MMSMIQGHRVAKTCVIGQSSLQGLLVERFDRHLDRGRIHRIHQEDFCQALGLGPSLKYERNGIPPRAFSAEVVGSLLDLTQLPGVARLAFFEITVANILLGNSDNHAKNHAFLYTGRRPVLAPAYDIDPVMLDDVSHEMSFRVGSARMGDDVTGADLDLFLKSIGMRGFGSRQKQRCGEIARLAVLAASDLPRPAGKLLGDVVRQQAHHLSLNVSLGLDVPDFDNVPVNRP
jgi:serine/threonine-protein kinase HipA